VRGWVAPGPFPLRARLGRKPSYRENLATGDGIASHASNVSKSVSHGVLFEIDEGRPITMTRCQQRSPLGTLCLRQDNIVW